MSGVLVMVNSCLALVRGPLIEIFMIDGVLGGNFARLVGFDFIIGFMVNTQISMWLFYYLHL